MESAINRFSSLVILSSKLKIKYLDGKFNLDKVQQIYSIKGKQKGKAGFDIWGIKK